MRILVVTPMPPRSHAPGAIPRVLNAQLKGLALRNEVVLATVAGPDRGELDAVERLRQAGTEVHCIVRRIPRGHAAWPRRSRLAATWLRGALPWRTIWFAEPGLQPVLDDLLANDPFDVVAVEDNSMACYRFETTAPVVLTEHDVRQPRPINWHLGGPRDWPRSLFREADWARWRSYQRRAWQRCDLLQVFTPRDAEAALRLAPELDSRVRVTPFGIDLAVEPAAAEREDPGCLLFVGDFTHPPNVDAAVHLVRDIWPRLRQRSPQARLELIGRDPPREVRALGGDGVEVRGQVAAVEPYFARAAIVLAPVRIGGGMRVKVLEAMALGKPVITTALGIEGLAVAGTEVPVVLADGADATAEAAADLLSDADRRRSLGEQARRFVQKDFSAEAYASRLERIYAEAIDASRARRA